MKKKSAINRSDFLKSGSTLVDLACGSRFGAFLKGKFYFLVGDSNSGKSYIAHTIFAEAAKSKAFANYQFIYDDVEGGALMDKEQHFGKAAAQRIKLPKGNQASTTVEEFYFNLDDAMHAGPCIYVLDSMDSLDTDTELERFQKLKKAKQGKGKEENVGGSYGVDKAKMNSTNLRKVLIGLRKTGSILIIISQTRDNLGFGFEKKTRAGGRALRFYATLEIWISQITKITKTVRGKKRQLGIKSKVQVKKNRITGRDRSVEIDIYHSFGLDDVGSCIDYLVGEKHWLISGGKINAEELEVKMTRPLLIKYIEENDLERELAIITSSVWEEIEDQCSVKRKKRYV